MTPQLLPFTVIAIITYLTSVPFSQARAASEPFREQEIHYCGGTGFPLDKSHWEQFPNQRYARSNAANLNVGQPRAVRMIYFLPNDRPFRPAVVQKMKDQMRKMQTLFAEQMKAHGYGRNSFRVETDAQGEPWVHRLDGRNPDSHYLLYTTGAVLDEIQDSFNLNANVYFIVIDYSIDGIGRGDLPRAGGVGGRVGIYGGFALVPGVLRFETSAHELGHAFGLLHDFNDNEYIMAYGQGRNRLSACHAEFLSAHPYFNLGNSPEAGQPPIVTVISPRTYPAGSQSIPVRLRINDSEGLHQVILFVETIKPHFAAGFLEVKACRGLTGEKDAFVEFDYDGVIPSDGFTNLTEPVVHLISVSVVDSDGNVSNKIFNLFPGTLQALRKVSGDNQHGLPNKSLPVPLGVEVRDLNYGNTRSGIPVTFSITAGGGALSATHTSTDVYGRAETTLTLGPNLGTSFVTASATGIENTVTFTSIAGGPARILDANLRMAFEIALEVAPGNPIAPADLASLTDLSASNANINNLTGIKFATNLTSLSLPYNNISDISSLEELKNLTYLNLDTNFISDILAVSRLSKLTFLDLESNSITDISAVSRLTNLTLLDLGRNAMMEISAVAELTNLTLLNLAENNISDISAVEDLTSLTNLHLSRNNITDISPLVANTGLGDGDRVHLIGNPLSYQSIHTHIPNLQSRGVEVSFDRRWPQQIRIVSGNDQLGLPGEALEKPFVVQVNDQSDNPFPGVQVTFTVTSGEGVLSATTATTDSNGRAESILTLGQEPGTNIVTVSVAGTQVKRRFTAEGIRIATTFEIISGNDQQGLPGEALEKPFVVQVRDQFDSPLSGVHVTFTVSRGGGKLSAATAMTGSNGRAESVLTLGPNPGTNTVTVSVSETQARRTFNAEGVRIPNEIWIISGDDQQGRPGETLGQAFVVEVRDQFDKPLTRALVTFTVTTGGGTLSTTRTITDENGKAETMLTLGGAPGTNTVRITVEGNSEAVAILTIDAERAPMFTLSIPAGTHAIHIPLAVNQINGEDRTIDRVSDLYNALGGDDSVNYIIHSPGPGGSWGTYIDGGGDDAEIADDTGLVILMKAPKTLELVGDALGDGGSSMIDLYPGTNVVGVPLEPVADMMISDLLLVEGVSGISISKASGNGFDTIRAADDPGDRPLMGGVGYLISYVGTEATSIANSGSPWENDGGAMAAPAVAFDGSQTPVLYVEGGVMDEFDMLSQIPELRVTAKNLSTGASLDTVLGTELSETAYSATFVELSRRAAKVGDVLEIVAHSPNPYVGVRPVRQIVVSAEEVLNSRIKLPDLELYEIPSETELLANYPNPFNPETWIPYRLSKPAEVTLEIYDAAGNLVRTIDVGFKPAAVYDSRASAIYCDGRNNYGERIASGAYFYHLFTDGFSATRKMLILK